MKLQNSLSFSQILKPSSFLSKLTKNSTELEPFLARFSSIHNIEKQILDKSKAYTNEVRTNLVNGLREQGVAESLLERLSKSNCYTITTGHQLNLLTGPLYSIYKIASAIKIAEECRAKYPEFDFVPVFWMATEDHDFEEINHINLFGNKIEWNTEQKGAVGRFTISGMDDFKEEIKSKFREFPDVLNQLLNCYKEGGTLAESHRELVSQLFDNNDLVILDGDSSVLKSQFVNEFKQELDGTSFQAISKQNELLEEAGLKAQAHAREVNIFYLSDQSRQRIVKTEAGFETYDQSKTWSVSEMNQEIETHPERFSPNVVLRPLYQEKILPNLMYIGGGGELAYWTQLKNSFESFQIPMPMIQVRYSALLLKSKIWKKWESFGFSEADLFLNEKDLVAKYVAANSETIEINHLKPGFEKAFEEILSQSNKVNASLDGYINGEKTKLIKSLEAIEKRIQKNQRSTFDIQINQISKTKAQLFPMNNWQERVENIIQYLANDEDFIPKLFSEIDVMKNEMNILLMD